MQLPYFSPNWVEATEPIWEGSLEESSSATLLGIGLSSLLPGADCNCHWMKRAPQKWSAIVVCWGYVGASFFLCCGSISQYRHDEIGRLVLFTSVQVCFWGVLLPWEDSDCSMQPSCALIKMTYYLPSTHCVLFSAYILFSSEQQVCYLVHEALLGDEDASRCRLTLHAAPQSQDLWQPFSLQPVMKKQEM